jgi:phenylalanyl-tRNA synthetase beta chain
MLLPRETPAGRPLAEIIGPPEPVLNIEVTPNRGDCLSMIGIAREIAALCGGKIKLPETNFDESARPVEETASVLVEDPESCPRYTARVVSGIKLAASPAWMRRRLLQCGIRPINNAVDITNYVMMECGQPLHAFDMACLREGKIVVRRARAGEPITTLDDTERKLTPEMLVIADAAAPVALAGVMGGASSCISASTGTVLLESACFKPAVVRKSLETAGTVLGILAPVRAWS